MESQATSGGAAAHDGAPLPKSCSRCRGSYAAALQFCPRDGMLLRSVDGSDDLSGQVIGDRYLVLREIDSGGMGRVYLAQHVRMGRRCAVKIMRRELLADQSAQARFHREAESASLVNHPNVATIYDFGDTSDGTVYLAMEYVPGEPLTRLLEREGPLAPLRASAIVGQIAAGLEAAHELSIVHRDLKPDNVMVTRHRDGRDCVKLVDFGIAKALAGDGGTTTAHGFVVGTPDYMAPEQAAGRPVDARADVYALGLVAYRLLTDTFPFAGDTPLARMLMRLSEPPRSLAAQRPDVAWPSTLQSVLDRALARDPAERYQSARALAHDLAAAVADWQLEPRRHPWRRTTAALRRMVVLLPTRVLRGGDRGRALVAGAGALAAAAALAIAIGDPSAWDRADAPPYPPAIDAARDAARDGAGTSGTSGLTGSAGGLIDGEPVLRGDLLGGLASDGDAVAPDTSDPAPGGGSIRVADRAGRAGTRRAVTGRAGGAARRDASAPPREPRDVPAAGGARAAPTAHAELERLEDAAAALRGLSGPARERSARAALVDVDRLLPTLRSARDSVAALYSAAEVHLSVGDAAAACTILRRIREPARRTEFASGIESLLSAPAGVCRAE